MRTALLVAIALIPGYATTYDYVTFTVPGGTGATPQAINNSGVVVGYYVYGNGNQGGFLRAADGTITTFNVPGAATTAPASISSTGWIAGSYSTVCCDLDQGFRLAPDGKTFATFQVNGGTTLAVSVNSSGQVTGYASNAGGFLTADGQTFTTFGDSGTHPYWINDRGDIVGYFYASANYPTQLYSQAFRRITDGTYSAFGLGEGSQAVAINNSYQVVGSLIVPSVGQVAYLRGADGTMTNLNGMVATGLNNNGQAIGVFGPYALYNPDGTYVAVAIPGASSTQVLAINDSGQITGTYSMTGSDGEGHVYGFLASPMAATTGPAIRSYHGVIGASGFGGTLATAPGSWIEIYGEKLAGSTRAWRTSDFVGDRAPTSLDGVSVSINGQAAYIAYISPEQVNAWVPSSVAPGTANVTVSYGSSTSPPEAITVNALEPALLTVNGCLAPVFADGTFVKTSCLPSTVPQRMANPGDVMVFYGIGFGPVTPVTPDGQIVAQANRLDATFSASWSNLGVTTPGQVNYAGLAPDTLGIYQFNVVAPPAPNVEYATNAGITGTLMLNGVTISTFDFTVTAQ